MNHWPAIVFGVVVLAAGCLALDWGTQSGGVWTLEGERRAAIRENPLPLPTASLEDAQGEAFSLAGTGHNILARNIVVLDFVYSRCPTVCLSMGARFRQMQAELVKRRAQGNVGLLSLSFDPDDDAAALQRYLARFGATPAYWQAARFVDPIERESVLEALGIIVIPEPTVGYVHNAAFYLVEDGRLVEIFDVEEFDQLFDRVMSQASPT